MALATAVLGPSGPSVGELVGPYLTHRVAQGTLEPGTARNHRSTLTRFGHDMGERPVAGLTVEDIERWLAARRHLRPATRRAQLSTVKTFCAWLVKHRYMVANPVLEVATPRQPRSVARAISSEDVDALLVACQGDVRAQAVVQLMVGLGLRCCEVENLELGHWDRRARVMVVRGKGDHERVIPVSQEAADAMLAYLAEYPAGAGPLIRSYKRPSRALSADALSGMVSELMRKAGIKRAARDGVSAHALRATAASEVLDTCDDLRVVQEMLGHKHLATTQIYLRRAGLAKMRRAMDARSQRSAERNLFEGRRYGDSRPEPLRLVEPTEVKA